MNLQNLQTLLTDYTPDLAEDKGRLELNICVCDATIQVWMEDGEYAYIVRDADTLDSDGFKEIAEILEQVEEA